MSNPTILLLGTLDTKGEEILYLRTRILVHSKPNTKVLLADVGQEPASDPEIDIPQSEILSHASSIDYSTLSRGEYIEYTSTSATNLVRKLFEKSSIHAIIGIGGSGGTSLCASIMRNAVPISFPKLIVSTMAASGNSGPYFGETDITMMYSVVDIAGINSLLKGVLDNAAGAISGLAQAYWVRCKEEEQANSKPRKKGIGITMFGITTPCVEMVKEILRKEAKDRYETYIFHATGAGGKAMERLIRGKRIDAVLDITTTEIADYICGGVLSAGPERLSAAAEMGIPQIVSVGACDCVNFGPRDSVPEKFRERVLMQHNPDITLMRSNADECAEIGSFISGRLKEKAKRKELVKVCLPMRGTSLLAVEGGEFFDSEADKRLFEVIKNELDGTGIDVLEKDSAVNDKEFAEFLAHQLIQVMFKP